jgi:hypothetical protein
MVKGAFFIIVFLFAVNFDAPAQEFYCNVEVNSTEIQTSDRRVYETMRNTIYEFMNNRKWTNYNYKRDEKIECSILINVKNRPASDLFECEMTIALRRPVYNSTYNTVLFNYIDRDIDLDYIENQPIDFNLGMTNTNMASILAYYAYLMLGLDFDSFMLDGGNPHFEAAQTIVNTAQNTNFSGWKSSEDIRNRYWLLENITNPSYHGLRQFYYDYHRHGLDLMFDDPTTGRQNILKAIKYLQPIKKSRPGLLLLQVISDAKRDEIVNVFSEGSSTEKSDVVNIMKEVDPSNTMTYQGILMK